jgi:hypothetical protein
MIKRVLIRFFGGFILLVVVIYAGDYLSLKVKVPPNRAPFGTITVQPYYLIHEKNNKTEYDFSPPAENDTCVNSLFPHFGYPTCWYLRRHSEKKIEV